MIGASEAGGEGDSRVEMVPGTGLEPAQPLRPPDPKSGVSANFTNPAGLHPYSTVPAAPVPRYRLGLRAWSLHGPIMKLV